MILLHDDICVSCGEPHTSNHKCDCTKENSKERRRKAITQDSHIMRARSLTWNERLELGCLLLALSGDVG